MHLLLLASRLPPPSPASSPEIKARGQLPSSGDTAAALAAWVGGRGGRGEEPEKISTCRSLNQSIAASKVHIQQTLFCCYTPRARGSSGIRCLPSSAPCSVCWSTSTNKKQRDPRPRDRPDTRRRRRAEDSARSGGAARWLGSRPGGLGSIASLALSGAFGLFLPLPCGRTPLAHSQIRWCPLTVCLITGHTTHDDWLTADWTRTAARLSRVASYIIHGPHPRHSIIQPTNRTPDLSRQEQRPWRRRTRRSC